MIPESLNSCLQSKKVDGHVTWKDIEACEGRTATSLEDLTKAPMEELKWILTIIGSLAAFFVIAQGGAAYFSAAAYSTQAERALKDIKEQGERALDDIGKQGERALGEIREIQKELRARYPLFRKLEDYRAETLHDFAEIVRRLSLSPNTQPTEALSWDIKKKLYRSIEVKDRQRILSVESFASIDLHPGPLGEVGWSDGLRHYAIFYQSKFEYERNTRFGLLADLQRAEAYLRLAIHRARGDFTLLNDLGVLCLDIHRLFSDASNSARMGYQNEYLQEAEGFFNKSLGVQSNQQRARYNLAVIRVVYTEPADYQRGRFELEAALGQSNWQRFPPAKPIKALLHYNLACYLARLLAQRAEQERAVLKIENEAVGHCLKHLNEAVNLGTDGIEAIESETIARDFDWDRIQSGGVPQEDGDLVGMHAAADPDLRDELQRIKVTLLHSTTLNQ